MRTCVLGVVCLVTTARVCVASPLPEPTCLASSGQRLTPMTSSTAARTSTTAPRRSEVFCRIDQAWRAGAITWAERLILRVQAVKAPAALPAKWRQLLRDGMPVRARVTPVLVEAFQERIRLPPAQRADLMRLLLPPDDLPYALDATGVFPIRVSFARPEEEASAETVLAAAVTAYQKEVLQWGFWPPPLEPGAGPYRIYLDDTGMGAGAYTSPYLENTATPQSDAFSYIVVDRANRPEWLRTTVAHEFNHACQLAMDAYEVRAFFENTATYVETQVYPQDVAMTEVYLPFFQGQPFRPLEYMNAADSDLYEYGGALWILFLEATYGHSDPRWIRRVWEASVQTSLVNEPDYMDALDEILVDQGGLPAAVQSFARARFFVGEDGDGRHIPGAELWTGSEVSRVRTLSTEEIPLAGMMRVPAQVWPQPNGCNYIVLNVTQIPAAPVRFSFHGDRSLDWSVQVMETRDGQDATYLSMPLDADGSGRLSRDVSELDQAVLVVCQMAGEGYDPDFQAWYGGEYTWSMGLDRPPPTVTSITPDHVAPGTHGLGAVIRGAGFASGDGLSVRASGASVTMAVERVVSDSEIRVTLFALPEAELGERDVIVTNPDGAQGTGIHLLTVAPDTPDETPEPVQGCSCRTGDAEAPTSPPALFLLLSVGLLLRSRRIGHRGPSQSTGGDIHRRGVGDEEE